MAFQPIPNTAKIILQGSLAGQLCENIFYARQGAPYDLTTLAELADAVSVWMVAPGTMSHYGTDFRFTSVRCISMEDDTGLQAEVPVLGDFGTHDGVNLPNNCTIAIHKIGTVGGRHGKGRVYHPGMTTTMLSDANTLSTAESTAICGSYRNLRDAVAAIAGGAAVWGVRILPRPGFPRLRRR